jgi:hypothetical protein
MTILRCQVITNELGVKQFISFAIEEGKNSTLIDNDAVDFNVFPNGEKNDLRTKPPFHQIIPCPYCGTDNDRKHDSIKHVDPKLGAPEVQVTRLARELASDAGEPDAWKAFTVKAANKLLSKRASP